MPRRSLFFVILQRTVALSTFAGLTAFAHAQTTAGADTVLGQRYLEAAFGATVYQGIGKAELRGSATLQIPVVNHLDADVTYSRSDWHPKFAGGLFSESVQTDTLFAGVTTYTKMGNVRIFGGAALFRERLRQTITFGGVSAYDRRTDTDHWLVDAGLEVSVLGVVVTPSVSYSDQLGFNPYGDPTDVVTYALEAHRWFTQRIGAFVAAGYSDPRSEFSLSGRSFLAGVRTRF